MNCFSTREFLGVKQEYISVTDNGSIDLFLAVKVKLVLATETPVSIGLDKLTSTDDNYCEGSGIHPFIEGEKLEVVFDASAKNKLLRGVITRLVPNPNYCEPVHEHQH